MAITAGLIKDAVNNAVGYANSAMVSLTANSAALSEISPMAPHVGISTRNSVIGKANTLIPQYGVRAIVSMSMVPISSDELALFRKNGIEWHAYPINDVVEQSLIPIAEYIHQYILTPRVGNIAKLGRVVVVCDMGVSRSVSIVLYHLMRTYKWNFDQALQWGRKRRKFIQPNPGFEKQLRSLRV